MSKKIEVKRTVDLNGATQILEELVASMKAGAICIQKGDECVTVSPAGDLKIEIEARQKKEKEGLAIELKWKSKKTSGMIKCTGHSRDAAHCTVTKDVAGEPDEEPVEIAQVTVNPVCQDSLPDDPPTAPEAKKKKKRTRRSRAKGSKLRSTNL